VFDKMTARKYFAKTERSLLRWVMSTHASVLVDSGGPPSVEVYRAAASLP
jgi:hypothetical protein